MSGLSNLRDKYFGILSQGVSNVAAESTRQVVNNAFDDIFERLPAETPPPRTPYQPEMEGVETPQAPYGQAQAPTYQAMPVGSYQQPFQQAYQQPYNGYQPYTPYMPPPPQTKYKIDEEKMRSMAKWRAAVNLKYVETMSNFARSLVGNLAATNTMVEFVERFERGELKEAQELEIARTMQKAVEKRRAIEKSKPKIISDDDMRNIYEELIFQEMYDLNERGELRIQDPNSFLYNYIFLTGAEILESGKEVIFERVAGIANSVSSKFKKK